MTDFLGLDYLPFSTETVHGGDGCVMTQAWKRRAREELAPVYDFVNGKFGDAVPAYWNDGSRYA